jgi:isochorismate synthase
MRLQTTLLKLDACRATLDEAIARARRKGRPVLVALATPPVRENLRDRLLDAPVAPKLVWTDRSGSRSVPSRSFLGLAQTQALRASDAAAAWETPDQARALLEEAVCPPELRADLRVFGGIAFDPSTAPHPAWPDGAPARFVLPQVLVRQDQAMASVLLTDWAQPHDAAEDVRERFEATLQCIESWLAPSDALILPPAASAPQPMAHERWFSQVEASLASILVGDVTKVVLSRDLPVRAAGPFPMGAVIRALEAGAPSGTVFGFQFDPRTAFVGATPERLVAVSGDVVQSDCLAGTCRRTGDAAEDDRLALALLADDKERREHAHVIAAVRDALMPLCRSLEVPGTPTLMVLPTLQHLHTPVTGLLREGVPLGTLIRRLHPTPAVGGTPRAEALDLIRELEERPRGWYAGALGWIAADAASFSVGIRSAILHPEGAVVFGGCGIVRGSDPAAEWDETQRKAATLLNLLTQGASA